MTSALASMEGRITTPAAALRFILAGNAYFTLRSAKTGTRYTYRVRRAESNDTNLKLPLPELARANAAEAQRKPLYFVSLLAGPDNGADYVYLGIIGNNGCFTLTRKSRMTKDSAPVVAISWTMTKLQNLAVLPNDLEIWHEGRCGRCGRMLTVPESIAAGLGPECAEKGGY